MRAHLSAWLLDHIPERVAAAPERVLINAACALIGLATLVGLLVGDGPRPSSLLALWPAWLSYEWAAAMILGGACALAGYMRGRRSVERIGYMVLGAATTLFAISALIVFGWRGVFVAVLYLGIAASKLIRLLVTSAARASVLRHGREQGGRP